MDKKHFIITEETKDYGWCLYMTLGIRTEESARLALESAKKTTPNKTLRLEEVEEKDCWWTQGWLD